MVVNLLLPYWTTDRRVRVLEIDGAALLAFLRGMGRGQLTRSEGLPEDARVVAIGAREGTLSLLLYVESETFEPVRPGDVPPPLTELVFRAYTPPAELWEQVMAACGEQADG